MFGFGNKRKQLERQYLKSREKEANMMFASRSNDVKAIYHDSKRRVKLLDQEMAERNMQHSVVNSYFEKKVN